MYKIITTDLHDRLPCIVFRNKAQSDKIHTWIYDAESTADFAHDLKELKSLSHIEILSVEEGLVKSV